MQVEQKLIVCVTASLKQTKWIKDLSAVSVNKEQLQNYKLKLQQMDLW